MSLFPDPAKVIENAIHARIAAIIKRHPLMTEAPAEVQHYIDMMKPGLDKFDHSVLVQELKKYMPTAELAELEAFEAGARGLIDLEHKLEQEIIALAKEVA